MSLISRCSCLQDTSQQALLHVGIWCVGEFGDQLLQPCPPPDGSSEGSTLPAVSEDEVLGLLDKCTRLHNADVATKALVLNSLVKLAVRLSPGARAKISALIEPFRSSMSLELQQRSTEYSMLLTSRWDGLRSELLGSMPVLDEAAMRR